MAASKELIEQLLADPKQAVCPQCGNTGFWDNREKAKGKAPWFVCKNKEECGAGTEKGYAFGVFSFEVKKVDPTAGKPETAAKGSGNGVKHPVTWAQMRFRFAQAVKLALQGGEQIGAKMGVPIQPEHITTMANSLMITCERTNCWPTIEEMQGKKKAAPAAAPANRAPVESVGTRAAVPAKDANPHAGPVAGALKPNEHDIGNAEEYTEDDELPF